MKQSLSKFDPHWRFKATLIAISCVLGLAVVSITGCGDEDPEANNGHVVTVTQTPVANTTSYTVKSGDNLFDIARRPEFNNVSWLDLMFTNEAELKRLYDMRCTLLDPNYRVRKRSYRYCNDRYENPWANSLQPGDILQIPQPSAPEIVHAIVQNAPDPIAIVIDDTGSMGNDRQVVGQWYLSAANMAGKKVSGIYLYSDGQVRTFRHTGNVEFLTTGGTENTFGALQQAASDSNPNSIMLITDEPGDDWQWSDTSSLPPVYGHCLSEYGDYSCESNLKRLRTDTGGGYVRGAK